jgi:alkylglycerol monooxygenase
MKVNYIALAIPAFFILIFIELLIARWQKKGFYRFNDSITDLSCGIGQQVTGVFFKTALYTAYHYIYNNYAIFEYSSGSIGAWLVAFFGVELAYYWWHRLSHQVNFMWAVHVVHHQSEEYNLAVALRQAWFSSITGWLFYAPLALLGVPPPIFVAMSAFSTLYQFWIHTRAVGKLGSLEWILNTPSHHRVHHGRNYKYLDRNHGATLIIWDKIFGTFQEEEEEPLYGTVSPYMSLNPVWANFYYWVELARIARKAPHFIDKIKIWFMYPGWMPRGVVKEPSYSIEDPNARVRYKPHSPPGLNWYIMTQFIPITLMTATLMRNGGGDWLKTTGLVSLILLSSMIWGGLFEKRAWAIPLEIGRLIIIATVAVIYLGVSVTVLPFATAIVAIFAIWLLRYRRAFLPNRKEAVPA